MRTLLLLCLAAPLATISPSVMAAAPPPAAPTPLGSVPDAATLPKAEFVFEERVTLSPAVVMGETALGHRQYIPITGGKVAGPRLNGEVIPGGWDFQLRYAGGCGTLTADYFLRADDGTVIHVLNEGFNCVPATPGERTYTHPRFEAPKGKHDWLTRGTFVATIELDVPPGTPPPQAGQPFKLEAIRIKFYQIR
jgi:hypothetical protein